MAHATRRRASSTRRRTRSTGSIALPWNQKCCALSVQSDEIGASSSTSKDKGFYQSDSDDISSSVQQNSYGGFGVFSSSSKNCQKLGNVVESDSFNENSPRHLSVRRKRKLKRVAMDVDDASPAHRMYTNSLAAFTSKKKQRLFFKHSVTTAILDKSRMYAASGKRKRALRDRSSVYWAAASRLLDQQPPFCSSSSQHAECKVLALSKLSLNDDNQRPLHNDQAEAQDDSKMDYAYSSDVNSAGFSSCNSSESELSIFTNDEGREGDDEQSDWVGESIRVQPALRKCLPLVKHEDDDDKSAGSRCKLIKDGDAGLRSSRRKVRSSKFAISDVHVNSSGRCSRKQHSSPGQEISSRSTSKSLEVDCSGGDKGGSSSTSINRRHTFSGFKKRKHTNNERSSLATHLSDISSSESVECGN